MTSGHPEPLSASASQPSPAGSLAPPAASRPEGLAFRFLMNREGWRRWFARHGSIALALFGFSLLLYLATLSWAPFPGWPAWNLLLHLRLEASPAMLHGLWGMGIRLAGRLPGPLSVAAWMGLFSAVCGAGSVALLARLMMRVTYVPGPDADADGIRREAQARRLSGVVSGLFLAFSIPFWVVSTRSLPGAFHLLMLLLTAWEFSQVQLHGHPRYWLRLGLLYGIGITEHPTFLVFLPLAAFLTGRELFRWRALRLRRALLAMGGGLLAGLSLYLLHALALYRMDAAAELYSSPLAALPAIWKEQILLITRTRFHPGFLVTMFLCLAPWLTLFVLSRRSPRFYVWAEVLLRLAFAGSLIAIVWNASFSPWAMGGMRHLLLMPYVLMAIAIGYMAGEFWIIGEVQPRQDRTREQRLVRHAAATVALAIPLAILLAGVRNYTRAQGRGSAGVAAAARHVLARLDGRDILFSNGVLDEVLRLTARRQGVELRLINVRSMFAPRYLAQLAGRFPEPALQHALRDGSAVEFIETLLLDEHFIRRVAVLDMPEPFREFAYLGMDGLLYRLEPRESDVSLDTVRAGPATLRRLVAPLMNRPAPAGNPVHPYQQEVRLMAARMANNMGVRLAQAGDEPAAHQAFRAARRMDAHNVSALLNLLGMLLAVESPEAGAVAQELERANDRLAGARWALAMRSGYVWNARKWVQRGRPWALSGEPRVAEGLRRRLQTRDPDQVARALFLDMAYLQSGRPPFDESHYHLRLMRNERDAEAWLQLARLALRRDDPDVAEAFIQQAVAAGVPETRVLFDRAMIAHFRQPEDAYVRLQTLARTQPGDMRVWMALRWLTPPGSVLHQQSLRNLQESSAADIGLRLGLAWLWMSDHQWVEAYRQIEAAIQLEPRNPAAWEAMATLARIQGRHRLWQTSRNTLTALNPRHPIQLVDEARRHAANQDWDQAEAVLLEGIHRQRQPDMLVMLASVLMQQRTRTDQARVLLDEALTLQPFHPQFRLTRAQLHIEAGDLDAATADIALVLHPMPHYAEALLLDVSLRLARGERESAVKLMSAMHRMRAALHPAMRSRLDHLSQRMPPAMARASVPSIEGALQSALYDGVVFAPWEAFVPAAARARRSALPDRLAMEPVPGLSAPRALSPETGGFAFSPEALRTGQTTDGDLASPTDWPFTPDASPALRFGPEIWPMPTRPGPVLDPRMRDALRPSPSFSEGHLYDSFMSP